MTEEHKETQIELSMLNVAEARLFGCLVEKKLLTPDIYPLTIKAAQQPANQKTSRDPVMELDQGTVHPALYGLEQMGFARSALSARAERYEHLLVLVTHPLGLVKELPPGPGQRGERSG